MQVHPSALPNPQLYKLLQPVLAQPSQDEPRLQDMVNISPQALARKLPTTLDSLLHLPERLNGALSLAGSVISWLAGPFGFVLGGLGILAIPAGVLAHKRNEAKQDST
ncbi:MAG: hypothetical protein U0931_26205 [Vulcanimicrobiota bacterium]